MIKLSILLLFITYFSAPTFAQKQIKGKVKDSEGKPITSVSINIKNSAGNIINFTRTNDLGEFSLTLREEAEAVSIDASSIGFKIKTISLDDAIKNYEIVLESSTITLAPVIVKNKPALNAKGDTLNYITSDFADKQDRTIGDVIKKMPGIEVAENGKISYNGKAISNLYVDGDNLLDDKYNIATKSIPFGAVDKVQVIEKDQPIKMLRENNTSEDVALNLVINEKAKLKLLGDAKLGAGMPERFDANLTGMMFKKNLKFINNLKGNNIGIDPAIDITAHNFTDYQKRIDNNKPATFLAAGAAPVPLLPATRSVFNKAGLANFNNLYKLNTDWQLKANVAYLYDSQQQQFNKSSETYLPNQTIRFDESQNNTINPQKLFAQLNLNGNSQKYYLNNSLIADYTPFSTNSAFVINNQVGNQLLKQETFDLSNEFTFRKKFESNRTINFYSFINRTNQPENLAVLPGLNEAVFNNGCSYLGLDQFIKLPTWFTNNYFAFALVNKKFSQTYKTGFSHQKQDLSTQLFKTLNNQTQQILAEASNELNWQKSKIYTEGLYEYNSDKFKAGLSVPISLNQISYRDDNNLLNKKLDRFFLNPALNLKYQTGVENYITTNYAFKNDLGGIDDIYRGSVLRNYRSLFANNAPIGESKSHLIGAGFNYRKAMQMLFFTFGVSYNNSVLNTISAFTLSNNIQQRVELPLENSMNTFSSNATVSKYVFSLKSTVSASVNYSNSQFSQFQNGVLLPFTVNSTTYKSGIEAKVASFLNWSYQANYTHTNNKSLAGSALETNFNQLRQQSSIALTVFKSAFISLSAEHLFTQQSAQKNLNYVFADFNVRYKLIKWKTDIEFGITNLANIKNFEAIYVSVNANTRGSYQIPGRVAMLKTTFNF